MKGKATIVVTYDDVLEYTSYDLYLYLRSQIVTFSKFLDIYKLQTKKESVFAQFGISVQNV